MRMVPLLSEIYVRRTMPQLLSTFDLTMTFLMILFFINNPVGIIAAGPAAFSYWLLGACFFFLPCILATMQLSRLFPHAGSTYLWTEKALGSFWSLLAAVLFWIPGVLALVGVAAIGVALLQGLNASWFTQTWQQGLLLGVFVLFSALFALQRQRVLQNVVNVTMLLMLVVVGLLGIAVLYWLLTGHHNLMTDLSQGPSSGLTTAHLSAFSMVMLAYLGTNVSQLFAGETRSARAITRHVLYGAILVLVCYLIVTLALLVVLGPGAAAQGPFAIITLVDTVFGKAVGDIVAICAIAYCLVFCALLNSAFARLLMTMSIDRRLPISLSRLNKNRLPSTSILFQTGVALGFVVLIFLFLPYVLHLGRSADFAREVFTVTFSIVTLVWACASIFLFIDLLVLALRQRKLMMEQRVAPLFVLWYGIIVAPVVCLFTIVVTLGYSPLPQQIDNAQWFWLLIGLTLFCLLATGIGCAFASSEVMWQNGVRNWSL